MAGPGVSAGRRLANPLEDPLFQQQAPPVYPPLDAPDLVAQGERAFPPLADPPTDQPPASPPELPPPPADQVAPPPPAPPPAATAPPPTAPQVVKTETQQTVLSPESKAALAEGRQLSVQQGAQAEQLAAAQKDQGEARLRQEHDVSQAEALKAQYAAKVAEETALQNELAQAEFKEAEAKADGQLAAAKQAEEQKYQETRKPSWSNQSVGYRILNAILMGSSINNANILHQDPERNPVLGSLREEVQQEKDRRLSDYRRSKEFVAEARLGPERARDALLAKRADIAASTEANLQFGLKRAEALATSRKVDPKVLATNIAAGRAESDARLLATKQELVDRHLERGKLTNRVVTTTAMPAPAGKAPALIRWQGRDYNVGDEVTARKMIDRVGATETLNQQLDKLAGLLEQGASPLTTGDQRAKIDTQIGILTGDIKESKQLGALDTGVQRLVGSMINDPTKIKNWLFKGGAKGALAGIRAVKEEASRSIENSLAANPHTGFAPRAPGPEATATADISVERLKAGHRAALAAGDKKAAGKILEQIRAREAR